ncbi:MAG: flagellar basal body-associated FliL family protein [Lachnospiraceae bacterium]|jgi:flagellar FliL protein|nr:flagellar basal body-associated FliL family protein [Lachnospiraceae bacterium]
MKKNLLAVLILALVMVNLAFTAIMAFSIVPATKNANKLIEDVAKAIHLELNAGKTIGQNNVSMENVEERVINGGETQTITLKKGDDGKDHFAVVTVYLALDKENEDYSKFSADLKESTIMNYVMNAVSSHTKEELGNQEVVEQIQDDLLEDLQALFDSNFIVAVGFKSMLLQ